MSAVLDEPGGVRETQIADDKSRSMAAPLLPGAHLSVHPVLQHKLCLIRKRATISREFRALFREISFYLGYEATQSLNTKTVTVTADTGSCTGRKISESVAVIPILRGGLGMADAVLELLPNAPVYHIGMYRNPGSNMPIQYYNRLPKGHPTEVAIVLDPIIASSKTICATVSILKKWGVRQIKVITLIASKLGLQQLLEKHPEVEVHLAAIDELAENGQDLIPGMGDAGDRLYLGRDLDEEDGMMSPGGKRSRMESNNQS